jgi:hypothetical protein
MRRLALLTERLAARASLSPDEARDARQEIETTRAAIERLDAMLTLRGQKSATDVEGRGAQGVVSEHARGREGLPVRSALSVTNVCVSAAAAHPRTGRRRLQTELGCGGMPFRMGNAKRLLF